MSQSENLKHYEDAIASLGSVERKGKTMPYTSLNGHMFSFLDKDGVMGLRLSKEDKVGFEKKYKRGPMMQYGREMKEYVVIPEKLLKDIKILSKYMKMSYEYVSSLKPKPTKKS